MAKRSHSDRTPDPANGDEVKRIRHDTVEILASVTTTANTVFV
jgi:hypothetical protein